MLRRDFGSEIKFNQDNPALTELAGIELPLVGSLAIRLQGGFVTRCVLTSPSSGEAIPVLYAADDLTDPKLTASHIMSPVGPDKDGFGGNHGFPRYANYHAFEQWLDKDTGAVTLPLHAMRSDMGLGLSKKFSLAANKLVSTTVLRNNQEAPEATSLGEHNYFVLDDEDPTRLTVNGKSLDALLGEGATDEIMDGNAQYWPDFPGFARIAFPKGYGIDLTAIALRDGVVPEDNVGMLFWHKKGIPSICFEPTVGFDMPDRNKGAIIPGYSALGLRTEIELL